MATDSEKKIRWPPGFRVAGEARSRALLTTSEKGESNVGLWCDKKGPLHLSHPSIFHEEFPDLCSQPCARLWGSLVPPSFVGHFSGSDAVEVRKGFR